MLRNGRRVSEQIPIPTELPYHCNKNKGMCEHIHIAILIEALYTRPHTYIHPRPLAIATVLSSCEFDPVSQRSYPRYSHFHHCVRPEKFRRLESRTNACQRAT